MTSRRKFIQRVSFAATSTMIAPSFNLFAKNNKIDWDVPIALQKEMYNAAIAIAKKKVRGGVEEPLFKKPFLDAAFNGNIFLWDTCFIACYAKYHQDELPITNALDNFYNLQEADGYICREYTKEGKAMWPKEYPITTETIKYSNFIKENSKNPVDYVFDLFAKYDIVVLSERYHPEYTQYELISKIITDYRFINQVGNVFTETGSVSFQDTLNTYLHTSFKNETELDKSTAVLQRNSNGVHPIWTPTNHFDLLKQVNLLNNKLSDSTKINWYYADIPVNWEKMTKQNYLKGLTPFKRDSIMAENILEKIKNVISFQKKKKALVIMNTNHGYGLLNQNHETGIKWLDSSTTNYLMKALPGKVANVMLNTVSYIWTPIQGGKWDASFKIAGNPNVGFNFKESPFGDDKWDAFILSSKSLTYKDIFTGYIFYKPLKLQIRKDGFPFELENFGDSLLRRSACVDSKEVDNARALINLYKKDPTSILQVEPAPNALFLNGLNIILFPIVIMLIYLISLIFLFKKV